MTDADMEAMEARARALNTPGASRVLMDVRDLIGEVRRLQRQIPEALYNARVLARGVALEKAAKVADSFDVKPRTKQASAVLSQKGRTARAIAAAIRALKG